MEEVNTGMWYIGWEEEFTEKFIENYVRKNFFKEL